MMIIPDPSAIILPEPKYSTKKLHLQSHTIHGSPQYSPGQPSQSEPDHLAWRMRKDPYADGIH